MAEPINSDKALRELKHPGGTARPYVRNVACEDAKGLRIQVTPSGAKSWIIRFTVDGKRREHGLGPYPAIGLSEAREKARDKYKSVKRDSADPIAIAREQATERKATQKRQRTFAEAVEDYLASGRVAALKTDKLREQRRYVLETYAVKHIGKMQVAAISTEDVERVLEPIWRKMPATADKVIQYVAGVFNNEIALRHRAAANPATRKALTMWIETQGTRETKHHAAVRVDDAPEWFAALRAKGGTGARALEFVVLTAARVGMVRGMTWDEIRDFERKRTWTIPTARMKSSRKKTDRSERPKPFRVPLSDAAVELLKGIERRAGVDYVFPADRDGMLSDMTVSKLMKDLHAAELKAGRIGWLDAETKEPAVPHGLRSTFRDWSAERGYAWELGEVALAHAVGDKTSKAYLRGDMLEPRREMMQDWADYLTGTERAEAPSDPLAAALAVLREAGLSAEDIAERLAPPVADNVVPLKRRSV